MEAAKEAIKKLNGLQVEGRKVHFGLDRRGIEKFYSQYAAFVANIPWELKEEELQEKFKDYNAVECYIFRNAYGRSRGYGLVHFMSEEDKNDAISKMDGTSMNDRVIEVS